MRRVTAPKRIERNYFSLLGAAIFTLSVASAPLIAVAQTEPPAVSGPTGKSPDYEANVKSLAFVMGALHSLQGTCGSSGDQTWRLNMQSLLDREGAPGAPLRVGMINAFNDGFQEQQKRYPTCNAGAIAAKKNFGFKGGSLSRQLASKNY